MSQWREKQSSQTKRHLHHRTGDSTSKDGLERSEVERSVGRRDGAQCDTESSIISASGSMEEDFVCLGKPRTISCGVTPGSMVAAELRSAASPLQGTEITNTLEHCIADVRTPHQRLEEH